MGILSLILHEPGGRRAQKLPTELDYIEVKWYESLAQLERWLAEHSSEPRGRSEDADERRIASWLRNQKSRNSATWRTAMREAALDRVYPEWRDRSDARWTRFKNALDEKYLSIATAIEESIAINDGDSAAFAEMACNAAVFYGRNSRQALRVGVEEDEARLALWINRVRTRLRAGNLPNEYLELLNAIAPGWGETAYSAYWITRQVKNEIEEKGEAGAADAYKQSWASLSVPQKKIVSELLPNAAPLSIEEWTRARADEIIRWRRDNGRFPINGRSAKSRNEATLAASLSKFRRSARDGTLEAEIAEAFHSAYPLWLTVRKTEEWFRLQAENLAEFHAEHERWPTSIGMDADEKKLGIWLQNQRQAKRGQGNYKWSSDRETLLNEICPGWFDVGVGRGTGRGKWGDTLDKLAAWLEEQGKKPRLTSSNEDERRLATWLSNQKSHRKRGVQWSPEREAALSAVYPGWAS